MNRHRKAAEGEACVRCGNQDGTIVLCHYQGSMSHRLGKGMGIKPHDVAAGAWLCSNCHDLLDGRKPSYYTMDQRSLDMALCCMQTVKIRYERGDLHNDKRRD